MLRGVLINDFEVISEESIYYVCLLVAYHDLMGDIIGNGRSHEELKSLGLNEEELYMLAALSEADICSLENVWSANIFNRLGNLIVEILR